MENYFRVGADANDGELQGKVHEFDLKITPEERKSFATLDAFGEAGVKILSRFNDLYLPNNIKEDSLTLEFHVDTENLEYDHLTPVQRKFIKTVFSDIERDHADMMDFLKGMSREEILKNIESNLSVKGESPHIDPDKVSIAIVPAGIALLVHDREYFEQKFPYLGSGLGFYRRRDSYHSLSELSGKIIVIDSTDRTAGATLHHEYLHLLVGNYIEPHEIPPNLPVEFFNIDEQIEELKNNIDDIDEEMGYADPEDVPLLQQEKENFKKQIVKLERKKVEMIDSSEEYYSEQAHHFFKIVRDELCAHAIGGEFTVSEGSLIPNNISWNDRIQKIEHLKDRDKISSQWIDLKNTISLCMKYKIAPEEALPIFLTSQSFDQISKRLKLLIKKYLHSKVVR